MSDAGLFCVHALAFALTPEVYHEKPQIEHTRSKRSFQPLHSLHEANVLLSPAIFRINFHNNNNNNNNIVSISLKFDINQLSLYPVSLSCQEYLFLRVICRCRLVFSQNQINMADMNQKIKHCA